MANLQKKSFWQQYGNLILILSGILIGALIGVVVPDFGTTIKPIGDIFLNLLFTIVVPLVFVSIASAVGSMANMKRLGKILGGTIGTFIFTGAIAGVCVLVWVNLFSPSAGTTIELVASEVGRHRPPASCWSAPSPCPTSPTCGTSPTCCPSSSSPSSSASASPPAAASRAPWAGCWPT